MKPEIHETLFGSITINGTTFAHDVVILLNGEVKKRKKKLSKRVYGTSHVVSLDEAKNVYEKGAQRVIVGSGQYGLVELSPDARAFFEKKKCRITLLPTPEAIKVWKNAHGDVIGLFHVTC